MECQIQKCLLPCLWILYSCLKTVASFEFHQVNTIPRFETTESFSCSGDSLTLLRSTNHVQQRDIWYELSLGTYPIALDLWLPQHVRYPLLSVETVPNNDTLDCTRIHTVTPDAIFLAGAVLHDIQWNNKVDDLQGWSFQSIQWNHQQPFDISIAETVSENHMLSFTLLHATASVASNDILLVPNSSLWLVQVYNKQPNSVDQVCLKFFVFGCAEQFLWDDPTTYDFPYVSMRNNYHSFEEARTSSHPHPYIAWYPFLWMDDVKTHKLRWNYSEPSPEESQQIDSWKLGDEYTVGVLTFSIDVSRIEWKRLSFGLSIGYATVPPFVDRWTRKVGELLIASLATAMAILLFLYYCHFERRKYTEDAVWSAEKLHSHHSCLPISEETVPLLYRNNTFTILNSMKTT
ncbi:hypothetical protein Gasu_31620 isoform 2 [Galdieria sulphuraria]|uniref:Uncharacterized protein n=1 Tax=Galdieria sulphuraria TaxID=130081 RepID=M2W1I4_GALSU|nr:hypothetical protein Gasu_31620 isoform 1 [Galdieria sulphuraria]XP_005706046.1 hypothetical protein Gasu_31620 isoform 2 [Galdieria sulphuraria]EME29525.1 hypothetical protein isoform 1 [Galdieria sulphuraria]EME29526.1 hypothetical protein isoform 2 [Galdieria sulphuraria]|eukprot:XP_005706045.1 hypothetical protein isoform 1 [Galdieria sulphuraria]